MNLLLKLHSVTTVFDMSANMKRAFNNMGFSDEELRKFIEQFRVVHLGKQESVEDSASDDMHSVCPDSSLEESEELTPPPRRKKCGFELTEDSSDEEFVPRREKKFEPSEESLEESSSPRVTKRAPRRSIGTKIATRKPRRLPTLSGIEGTRYEHEPCKRTEIARLTQSHPSHKGLEVEIVVYAIDDQYHIVACNKVNSFTFWRAERTMDTFDFFDIVDSIHEGFTPAFTLLKLVIDDDLACSTFEEDLEECTCTFESNGLKIWLPEDYVHDFLLRTPTFSYLAENRFMNQDDLMTCDFEEVNINEKDGTVTLGGGELYPDIQIKFPFSADVCQALGGDNLTTEPWECASYFTDHKEWDNVVVDGICGETVITGTTHKHEALVLSKGSKKAINLALRAAFVDLMVSKCF